MSKYQKIGKNDGREDLLFYPNTSILLDYGRIKCEYKKRQTSKTMFVFILNQNFNRNSDFFYANPFKSQRVFNSNDFIIMVVTYIKIIKN